MPKITRAGGASIAGALSAVPPEKPEVVHAHALPAPPAPQAGAAKWLAYATLIGIDVPEESREDKAALRALVDEK